MTAPKRHGEITQLLDKCTDAMLILAQKTAEMNHRIEELEEENDRLRRRLRTLEGWDEPGRNTSGRFPDLNDNQRNVVEAIEAAGITEMGRERFIRLVEIHGNVSQMDTITKYMRAIVRDGPLEKRLTDRGTPFWIYTGQVEEVDEF